MLCCDTNGTDTPNFLFIFKQALNNELSIKCAIKILASNFDRNNMVIISIFKFRRKSLNFEKNSVVES